MNRRAGKSGPLPPAVTALFEAAEEAGHTKRHGKQNVSLVLKGKVIGGWNTVESHWYITAASALGHEARLEALGFGTHNRKLQGVTWILPGASQAPTFKTALGQVTGVQVASTGHVPGLK